MLQNYYSDFQPHIPTAMPPDVAQAFGRMSLFLKDVSLITAHLANIMDISSQSTAQGNSVRESVAGKETKSATNDPMSASNQPVASAITPQDSPYKPKTVQPEPSQPAQPPIVPCEPSVPEMISPADMTETSNNSITPSTASITIVDTASITIVDRLKQPVSVLLVDTTSSENSEPTTSAIVNQIPKTEFGAPEWTTYRDAVYKVLENKERRIHVCIRYDGLKISSFDEDLESALSSGLKLVKNHARMLPKSKRDGQPHMVSSSRSGKCHQAGIYCRGQVFTATRSSVEEALGAAWQARRHIEESNLFDF
ncbi:hypothetical protein MJO28_015617 [Puccinia striiformis f. sp. tritici]|uniref:Uncharacterized protein n=1 Tax=Puccinia striiformis f. sp. tritici TaxID=168172 RepID=A0ACC0DPB7_9BASI|nr:hypothetical protein MJO28_015617 [Puccinia striiformis f. sp. tritici]